ncbi:aldo/keto reductase [Clostridium tertium]|uniref:aldo/keto reductase n=1 Tax=Clostridium TaxID=1485 RepID=UPI0022E92C2A|nr:MULTISPECIES: aldo/keto reductase [Clostridium]MDB1921325.1 aldo/keto reductase [Clostridium tertium]MDB1924570.1 aldo/keto reductase [Clostridium tertium]MDB1928100.1 aldo/keto reductase [Clostridium tertium]MDU1568341.1 aldo/keto reductase [Clostridium sp.]MDU2157391.1 aldo/keto reductase [Clostridium sp.]
MKYVTLNNGVKMPILGYGVYQIEDLKECERCVLDAIEVGYRLIDTAQTYGNEEAVGRAIKKCNVPREELFITTKVWISNAGYEKAQTSIEESLKKLQLEYLDLVLIHEPFNDYYGTYRAMEEMYKDGNIRAIGVSNFYPDRLVDLIKFNEVVPAINQVETHPFNQQVKAKEIMDKYGVQIESWAPFAEGRNNIFTNKTLKEVGDKYNKSIAQVALKYLIQRGVIVIPKSVHKERMIENFNIFDFKLDDYDMKKIVKLDKAKSAFFSYYDPDVVEIFAELD